MLREIKYPLYGVTATDVNNLEQIAQSLERFDFMPTTRIVFDEWEPATNYEWAVSEIHKVSYVMGELLDSQYVGQYSVEQYRARTAEYLNLLGDRVDIWEIGNEVNGHWVRKKEKTDRPDPPGVIDAESKLVIDKISAAYEVIKADPKRRVALTLYFNDDGHGQHCWVNKEDEMFTWARKHIPQQIKDNLDFVLVSYYEDDCKNFNIDWQKVFDELAGTFKHAKIGFGESGTKNKGKKKEFIDRYYRMKINHPNYVGGYFWWYFKQDMVPYTKKVNGVRLWDVLNKAAQGL